MTDAQIRSLDRCRAEKKALSVAYCKITEELSTLGIGSNSDKGQEISVLISDLRKVIHNAVLECDKGINKIITEL